VFGVKSLRMAPRLAGTHDGVERDDELSHDGGDDDFGGLAIPFKLIGKSRMTGLWWMATRADMDSVFA